MRNIRFKRCPCCNSKDFAIWWDNASLKILRDWKDFFYGGRKFIRDIICCCSCGYRFINAISPDCERWYSEQDIDVYRSMGVFRKRYFEDVKNGIINKFNPKFPADASVLDFACGDGLWLGLWLGRMKLFGTEVCDNFKKVLAGKKINMLNEIELKSKQYNIVSMFDFLEHIEEPDSFLIDKWSLVKPGGFLIIGVPDMGKIAALILGPRYYLVCPMHYSYFDCFSLNKLLKKACPAGNISIYPSPSLKTDLNGMLKWLGIKCSIPNIINFRMPVGYAPSIIAVVKKTLQT